MDAEQEAEPQVTKAGVRRVWPVSLAVAAVLVVGGGAAWLAQGSPASDRAQRPAAGPTATTSPAAGPTPTAGGSPVAGPTAHSYTVKGARLSVWFWAGVCEKYALRVDESAADRVTVRVVTSGRAPDGQVCPMIAKYQPVSAELSRPLGDRTVVDAADGRALKPGGTPPLVPRPGGAGVKGAKGVGPGQPQ
ncbi:hypothetical protein ACIQGZ_11065 [Streptomyces sp. NPDC092296]|uniref:hypothetical protein n=1 Tax=Streptomyces sp. NPDC092296 TaxID=3366012 RepID=UPI00382B37C8